jgi:hypothetical protein
LQRENKYKVIHLKKIKDLKVLKDLVTQTFVPMVTKREIKRRIVGCPRSALLVPIIAPRCAHFRERKIGQI